MALKIVISSYAGLLLLACIYPVLISLKIRPITAERWKFNQYGGYGRTK